jgi:hypothetical protein
MEFVWNNMDRQQFVQLRRSFLERAFPEVEVREKIVTEWGLKDLSCTYFAGAKPKDLNQDGVPEFVVTGRFEWRNGEEFIYAQTENGLKLILIDGYNIKTRIESKRRHGFPDITYFSNWSGGEREVKTYRFDGRVYVESECFSENHFIPRNGEIIQVDKLVRTRTKCDRRFGVP